MPQSALRILFISTSTIITHLQESPSLPLLISDVCASYWHLLTFKRPIPFIIAAANTNDIAKTSSAECQPGLRLRSSLQSIDGWRTMRCRKGLVESFAETATFRHIQNPLQYICSITGFSFLPSTLQKEKKAIVFFNWILEIGSDKMLARHHS